MGILLLGYQLGLKMAYFSLVKLFEYFICRSTGALFFCVWFNFGNPLHSMQSFTVKTIMKSGLNPRKLLLFFIKFGVISHISVVHVAIKVRWVSREKTTILYVGASSRVAAPSRRLNILDVITKVCPSPPTTPRKIVEGLVRRDQSDGIFARSIFTRTYIPYT